MEPIEEFKLPGDSSKPISQQVGKMRSRKISKEIKNLATQVSKIADEIHHLANEIERIKREMK